MHTTSQILNFNANFLWLSRGKGLLSHRYSAPLRRTSPSRWAKHEGALAHISLQRSVAMLALQ